MLRPTRLLAAAALALLLGCGNDAEPDREPAADAGDTTSTTEAEATTASTTEADDAGTTTTTAGDDGDGGSDDAPTISRGDAEDATGGEAKRASEGVEGSDLYFNLGDGVVCEAPDADQPDNLNERSSEWSCVLDHEVNGVRCEGTAVVTAEGEEFEEEAVVEDADIECEPA